MRIRSIHPQFWRSDDIAVLRRDIRLLFIGLWSYVDDNGVGRDDYRHIAADLFALEDDQNGVRKFVREGLATLSARSLIVRYEHDGKRYLYIPSWDKWQRVDRPSKPRYPRPDDCGAPVLTSDDSESAGTETPTLDEPSRDTRETPATGEGEKGRWGEGEKTHRVGDADGTALTRRDDDVRPEIDRLCTHLADRIEQNGTKRPTIGKRWHEAARLMLDRDGRTEQQIHAAIDWCQADEFWRSNVLSMPKLREKYDQLRLQAQRRNGPSVNAESTTDQRVRAGLALAAKYAERGE